MKKLILPLLMVAPLAAQTYEVGLFLGQQSYKSRTYAAGTLEPAKKTVLGARFGYKLVDFGPFHFQATAGFQPETSTTAELNGTTIPDSSFKQQHWSAGAMITLKAFVAVGAGLEYRSEKLTASDSTDFNSTTYGRPWVRVNVGIAFPTPVVKPFVGLEVAMPLTSTSYTYNVGDAIDIEKALRSYAPKLQVGVYGGIRF